jgi:predicted SprT family Zn-dependent metalloprotease
VNTDATRDLARRLMDEHGLKDWTLAFDRAQQRAGLCKRKQRVISLSKPLMSLWTTEQVRDTILHEIAHALTPDDRGHGREWRMTCRKIGADPTRSWGHNGEQQIEGKHLGTCPMGHTIRRHRRPKAARSCGVCSTRFDNRYLITWKEA